MAETPKDKDRSSKWLIEHHPDAILRFAGVAPIVRWRSIFSELTLPAQSPDGLIEAWLPGCEIPDVFVIEVATYPERRAEEQALRDTLLTLLDRRMVPEVVVLVLHPKGQLQVGSTQVLTSRLGTTEVSVRWRVVRLWEFSAEDALALDDPGLVPWIPLMRTDEPPERLLIRCRRIIEEKGPPEEQESLRVVTSIFASLRYTDGGLLRLLEAPHMDLMEFPLIQRLVAEKTRQLREEIEQSRAEIEQSRAEIEQSRAEIEQSRAEIEQSRLEAERSRQGLIRTILEVLGVRCGQIEPELAEQVVAIHDDDRLRELVLLASTCSDLEAFRAGLTGVSNR